MKVTIDRATWNTAERHGIARLLYTGGDLRSRCCLGFLAQACGVPDDAIDDVGLPSEVEHFFGRFPQILIEESDNFGKSGGNLDWENVLATLNDFEDIDDATRESWIAAGFRIVLGAEVEFVGSYPEPK